MQADVNADRAAHSKQPAPSVMPSHPGEPTFMEGAVALVFLALLGVLGILGTLLAH